MNEPQAIALAEKHWKDNCNPSERVWTLTAKKLAAMFTDLEAQVKQQHLDELAQQTGVMPSIALVFNGTPWCNADEVRTNLAVMQAQRALAQADAARLQALIDMCGSWHDGSSQVVKLMDDDATREYIVKVGDKYHTATSMRAAIDSAMQEQS